MNSSILYTIGTALSRAQENDVPVQVLVEGEWLSGRVAAVDGHGLVLHSDDLEHSVVRVEYLPRPGVQVRRGAGGEHGAASADARLRVIGDRLGTRAAQLQLLPHQGEGGDEERQEGKQTALSQCSSSVCRSDVRALRMAQYPLPLRADQVGADPFNTPLTRPGGRVPWGRAEVAELADAPDSKSGGG